MPGYKTITLCAVMLISPFAASAEELCKEISEKKPVEAAQKVAVDAGFKDVRSMGEEDGCYEAKGFNDDGSKFEVYIHPTSLEIVKVKKE